MGIAVVDVELGRIGDGIEGVDGHGAVMAVLWHGRRVVSAVLVPACAGRVSGADLVEAIERDGDVRARVTEELVRASLAPPVPAARPPLRWTAMVCTRDRPDGLDRCLKAMVEMLDERGEILVVDNAPSDGRTAEVAARYPVRYVVEPAPGLNRARRTGLSLATGDVVLLTDDDAVPDPGWVDELLAPFEDRRVAVVTGMGIPITLDTSAQQLFERYTPFHRGYRRREFDYGDTAPAAAGVVGAGVNMAFRRQVAVDLDVFAADVDAGTPARSGGDTYAVYLALADGWRAVYTPDAVVRHEHRRTHDAVRDAIAGYTIGVYVMLLRCVLRHRDLQAVKVGLAWFRHHHVRELARSLLRRPGRAPLDVVVAEWMALLAAPSAYRATRRRERAA